MKVRMMTLALSFALLMSLDATAGLLTLNNPDFQAGRIAGTSNPIGWTTVEGGGDPVYAQAWAPFPDWTLGIKDGGPGTYIEQSFNSSEATADTYGQFNVSMKVGWRSDYIGTRGDASDTGEFTVSIINVTEGGTVLGSDSFSMAGVGANDEYYVVADPHQFSITYDNTLPNLVGDEIAIRIERTDPAAPVGVPNWQSTIWADDVVVNAVPEPSAMLLMLTASLGTIGFGRRRR